MTTLERAETVAELTAAAARAVQDTERSSGAAPIARSVFFLQHGTRLADNDHVYRNCYVLVRVGAAFGACAFEPGQLTPEVCELSGQPLERLLRHDSPVVRAAALDAFLSGGRPHRDDPRAVVHLLPTGSPDERAVSRDRAIAGLLHVPRGSRVGLIGVVNPLVAAIRDRGAEPLLCDLNMTETHWGDPVDADMTGVLARADMVLATGMTVGNGSFDTIRRRCLERDIPLVVYAQSGSAVVRQFLGRGVHALSAEHFPFSQFSADASPVYLYRQGPPDKDAPGASR